MLIRRDERGFTMVAVLGVLLVGTLLATAAFQAVGGDLPFARASQDRKQAYQAAQAGIDWYKSKLAQDPDFWTECVPSSAEMPNAPIWLGTGTRVWRNATGGSAGFTWSGTGARAWHTQAGGTTPKFSITLVPSDPAAAATCRNNPEQALLSPQGTFTIESTGIVPDPDDVTARDETRTIVTTFRRKSFLDYLYFTDFETSDPLTYTTATERTNAAKYCAQPRAARNAVRSTFNCNEISFGNNDAINGPFHTNDDILVCGTPTFGRDQLDNVEISGPAANGWTSSCGGSNPTFKGTKKLGAEPLTPPANSNAIATRAQEDGTYLTGTNEIVLTGTTMTVNGRAGQPLPDDGVIYDAAQPGCGGIASPAAQTYSDGSACAVLYVKGNASRSLTIDSEADVVVEGDVTHSPGYVLGLIAGNFVRVKHKVNRSTCANAGTQGTDYFQNLEIDAAILALNHSFIVDNWDCGRLGTLSVKGAIAQEFRGPVGTYNSSTGAAVSGYVKDYSYDDKLKYRSPPYFLPPVDAAWRMITSHEREKSAGGT